MMAQSCVATSSSISVCLSLPQLSSRLSLSPSPLQSTAFRESVVSRKKGNKCGTYDVKAMLSSGFSTIEDYESSWQGIWSMRNDLEVPSSPYTPIYAQGEQGPSPMMHERFLSVLSQLFQHRIIRCGGPVDDDMAYIIVS